MQNTQISVDVCTGRPIVLSKVMLFEYHIVMDIDIIAIFASMLQQRVILRGLNVIEWTIISY